MGGEAGRQAVVLVCGAALRRLGLCCVYLLLQKSEHNSENHTLVSTAQHSLVVNGVRSSIRFQVATSGEVDARITSGV